jgi:hypothetical protein
LAGVLTGPRKRAKLNSVEILAKRDSWHGETLRFRHRILLRRRGESPPESDTAPLGISPDEFLRRFLLHVLPSGFHRIRHYGLLARGSRAISIDRLRALIATHAPGPPASVANDNDVSDEPAPSALPACPCCGGRMRIVELFGRGQAPRAPSVFRLRIDSS